jgi:TonB family protein
LGHARVLSHPQLVAPMRNLFWSLVVVGLVGCATSAPTTKPISAPGDPYPGSGGKFLSAPSSVSDLDASKFAAFQIGTTTKAQVATALGRPAAWVTRQDGTSQLEYAYRYWVARLGERIIAYTLFTFDANQVLTEMQYPRSEDDAATGPGFLPSTRDYYPPKARQQGVSGRVGLECSVDEKGYARDIFILESGGQLFDDAARRIFSDQHFHIPPDWSATGGPAKRIRYGVIFQVKGKPVVAPFEDHRETVVITSTQGR